MMKQKFVLVAGGLLSAFAVGAAVPQVTGVSMTQGKGTRDVTIVYTLANAPAVVTLDVQTNAVVDGIETWASIGGANIRDFAAGAPVFRKVTENGEQTILWHAKEAWPGFKIPEGGVRAVVTAWAVDDTPDYLVVTIDGSEEPAYYPSVEFLPGGLLGDNAYRTTKIVMRRLRAKYLPWTKGTMIETDRNAGKEYAYTAVLTNDYYLGVFPVTQAQWKNVTGSNPSTRDKGDLNPVNGLNYNYIRCSSGTDSTAIPENYWPNPPNGGTFLGKLRANTGIDFDLPGEGEWEFACRAGGTIPEGCWNDGSPRLVAGDAEDANLNKLCWNKYNGGKLGEVGHFASNALGFYDMHGGVWEWCNDWYAEDPSAVGGTVNVCPTAPGKLADGVTDGATRVQRGGCAGTAANNNRIANRNFVAPGNANQWYGCRVACRAGLK